MQASTYWQGIEKQQREQRGSLAPSTEKEARDFLKWVIQSSFDERKALDAHLATIGWNGDEGRFMQPIKSLSWQDAEYIWDRHILAHNLVVAQTVGIAALKAGASYTEQAVKVQEAMIAKEDALNPQKVFWFSQQVYANTRYSDIPVMGLCGWVLRRCKLFPRIREAISVNYSNAHQGLQMELPGAVSIAVSEIGWGEGFGDLVNKVALILEEDRYDAPANKPQHASIDEMKTLSILAKDDSMLREFEATETFHALLNCLTLAEQQVMRLVFAGWEEQDIATALNRSIGSVKTWKSRARAKMQEAYKKT